MNRPWYLLCLVLCGCKGSESPPIILSYDLYRHDSLETPNALTIEYAKGESPSIRSVIISGKDSVIVTYREKITDSGICRSVDGNDFHLTHSFVKGNTVLPGLPKLVVPPFLNPRVNTYDLKKYGIGGSDSVTILFFDEALPMSSFTNAYYCRECGFFILYYDPIRETYYRLSKQTGYPIGDQILKVTDQLTMDTLFFSKYLKPPKVGPPPM
jgi:hypothetical protein